MGMLAPPIARVAPPASSAFAQHTQKPAVEERSVMEHPSGHRLGDLASPHSKHDFSRVRVDVEPSRRPASGEGYGAATSPTGSSGPYRHPSRTVVRQGDQ